ncbi:phosphoribosyltransferase [Nocardia mangyaensis]|uniref:phosphoribosyltransferase n=1 Tax=Nocardia mangyaensis TaxID=2213200 RepID=UPI002675594D|nr:phosphoribosyltransferase [Nocardia mangyaensis]MDO3650504.1 phosphoribosyltransferase [Nocardia mangyaensis]
MSGFDRETPWASEHLGIVLHHAECFSATPDSTASPVVASRVDGWSAEAASGAVASSSAAVALDVSSVGLSSLEASGAGLSIAELVRPGLRRNPRRAHLLVSTVLGKHLPTDPRVVIGAGERLGDLVREKLGERAAVVLGFAETATGLGHCVAARLDAACYLHSTRRHEPRATTLTGFEEGHSHATSHLLQPAPGEIFANDLPLVLVDDEISTGDTAIDAVRALHAFAPRAHYVLASLVDMRTAVDRDKFEKFAAELGARIDTVCLAAGRTDLPDGLVESVAALPDPELNPMAAQRGSFGRCELPWPADVPEGGRHGILNTDVSAFDVAVKAAAGAVQARLSAEFPGRPVIVLGHEELMYLPLRLAAELADGGILTRFQTTTRSPAYVLDEPGYPLRRGFRFTAPEPDPAAQRYLYNAQLPDSDETPVLLVVLDPPADTPELIAPGGLVDVLTASGADVLLAVAPGADPRVLHQNRTGATTSRIPAAAGRTFPEALHGPDFGSYAAEEVSWLLKDLSDADLEADVADRERRIQAGVAHYAESLPVEYQPDAEYRELFDRVLAESAERLAVAVATVSELVVAERGEDIVLVSLARAGTPVGVLMRRWLASGVGRPVLTVPHYAVSIVRDRGIDAVALDYLAHHHDPSSIVFVDGWTGKGAITRELTEALDAYHAAGGARFNDELVVLADPGNSVRTYGTRDDFLIASACLNSTVSGLVSRTVLNKTLIGPRDFHGAKFYRELADADVSNQLLDAVTAAFPVIADQVPDAVAAIRASDRTPDWSGWASVERVRAEYGVASVNFVKPGVGETTRVLLRRVPWRVLVREADAPEHAHIRLLAAARDVPVEVVPDLAYSCMGLIKELDQ